jgi:hypothetical protein
MVRFKSIAVAAALAIALSGCAKQFVFDKPNLTNQDFNADKLYCLQTANSTVGGYTAFGTLLMIAVAAEANKNAKQDVFNTCMQARGYNMRVVTGGMQ